MAIILDFTHLAPFWNDRCSNASGGQQPSLFMHSNPLSVVLDLTGSGCSKFLSLQDITVHQPAESEDNQHTCGWLSYW